MVCNINIFNSIVKFSTCFRFTPLTVGEFGYVQKCSIVLTRYSIKIIVVYLLIFRPFINSFMLLQSHTPLMNKVTKREMKMKLILLAKMMKIFQMNLMKINCFLFIYNTRILFFTLENKGILISTNMFSLRCVTKQKKQK